MSCKGQKSLAIGGIDMIWDLQMDLSTTIWSANLNLLIGY